MPMVTPDVEADLLTKLAELLPDDVIVSGDGQNSRAGPLRPVDTGSPNLGMHEVYVQAFGGSRSVTSSGVLRTFAVQVTVRSAVNDYTGGHLLAVRIHDALECLGAWTGASGQHYFDTAAQIGHPNHLGPDEEEQELFSEPFDVMAESLRDPLPVAP